MLVFALQCHVCSDSVKLIQVTCTYPEQRPASNVRDPQRLLNLLTCYRPNINRHAHCPAEGLFRRKFPHSRHSKFQKICLWISIIRTNFTIVHNWNNGIQSRDPVYCRPSISETTKLKDYSWEISSPNWFWIPYKHDNSFINLSSFIVRFVIIETMRFRILDLHIYFFIFNGDQ